MTVNTQELRELVEKATPGPWTWKQVGTYSTPGVALFWPDTSKGGVHYRRLDSNGGMTEADADLITNAVRALPALLDEIGALRAELQARQWVSVEDRLPEIDYTKPRHGWSVPVIACWGGSSNNVAEMAYTANGYAKTERGRKPRFEWQGRISPWNVTHWQPLPLPPAPPKGETA